MRKVKSKKLRARVVVAALLLAGCASPPPTARVISPDFQLDVIECKKKEAASDDAEKKRAIYTDCLKARGYR